MTRRFASSSLVFVAAALFVGSIVACTGGPSGSSTDSSSPSPSSTSTSPNDPVGGSPGDGTGDGTNDGTPGTPSPPANDAPACTDSDDCPNWYCECESGPPVNTRHCTNGRCETAAQACPKSCKGFGTCWTGEAGGGWDGGTNTGPNECKAPAPADAGTGTGNKGCGDNTAYTDIGKACLQGTTCQSGQCWGVSPSFACTKRCTTSSECPLDWRCVSTSSGFNVCMQGSNNATGPLSTNASCAQVAFTDLGGGCVQPTDCQSYICLGSSYCSRRCETASDCPSGWSCKTGGSFKYCLK